MHLVVPSSFSSLLIDSHRTCALDQRRPLLSIRSEAVAAFNEMYRAFIPIHLNSPPATQQRKDAGDSGADWKQEMDKER